jgi:hypothetical protein
MYVSMAMTVVVPVALLASMALLALNGGIPGLGSLSQAFSGPAAAPTAPPLLGGSGAGAGGSGVLSALPGSVASGGVSSATLTAGRGGTPSAVGRSRGGAGLSGSPGTTRHGTGGAGPGRYPGGSPSGGGQPQSHPTVADRIVGSVTPVTSKLPAPVGPGVTKTLQSGGSLADRLLHHLPGR